MEANDKEIHWLFRWLIAVFCTLCALVMFLVSADLKIPLLGYGIGILGICAAITCTTKGKVRVIACSILSVSVLCIGLVYSYHEFTSGTLYSGSRSKPSIYNSIMFMLIYGVPSIGYLCKFKFGLSYGNKAP